MWNGGFVYRGTGRSIDGDGLGGSLSTNILCLLLQTVHRVTPLIPKKRSVEAMLKLRKKQRDGREARSEGAKGRGGIKGNVETKRNEKKRGVDASLPRVWFAFDPVLRLCAGVMMIGFERSSKERERR